MGGKGMPRSVESNLGTRQMYILLDQRTAAVTDIKSVQISTKDELSWVTVCQQIIHTNYDIYSSK